ncbi:hypothetical protein A9Q87_11780 [Flavobacteriales bacterium 34_180_T64]|nr:hypothetical protein A9Q87_11780 [Flavobacteriales bacterium 34_180_T64]
MLYAVGEIILVVIGILIALSINNKNQDRKERAEETIILKQLLGDFNINLEQLDQKISFRSEFMNSSKTLFKYIDNPSLRNKDSIDHHIAKTLPYATFDPIMNDLASSGELSLIKNIELKQALTHWSSNINDVIEDEVIWRNYRNDQYFPFLIQHYQLRTIRNKAYKSNVLGKYSLEIGESNDSYIQNNIGETKHLEDFNALLNHPNLEDHLTRCYAINSWANVQSNILRNRIVEIIEIIEQEIKS